MWSLRFDYTWGWGDQDEFIPYLLHLLDREVLGADWYVQTQATQIGVRTYFVILLRGLSVPTSPPIAVAILFAICWVGIATGIVRLVESAGGARLAAAVAVIGALCFTPKWTLGGNDLVYSMLVPEMLAWALAIPALIQSGRGRFVVAGILLGVASWFQLLAGVLTAGMLSLALLLPKPTVAAARNAGVLALTAFVVAWPVLVPVGLQQFVAGAMLGADREPLDILTRVRAPHHYIPSAFPLSAWIRFGLLVSAAALSLAWLRSGGQRTLRYPIDRLLGAALLMCIGAWLFTEVIPVGLVIKMQVFKITVLAKLLMMISIALAIERLIGQPVSKAYAQARTTMVGVLATLVVLAGLWLWNRAQPGNWHESAGIAHLESWASRSTSAGAVFAVPPSISSFRTNARRAIVVNYAAFPFDPNDILEWYRRLEAVAPVPEDTGSGSFIDRLDRSFYERREDTWRDLAEAYHIDYLVHHRASGEPMPFEVAYLDSTWVAYRLDRRIPQPEV